MQKINYPSVKKYIEEIYPDQEKALRELEDFARENRVPIIERESLEFLKTIIKIKKPKRILELGTAIGYSAIQMALLDEEIEITSLDRSEKYVGLARENIKSFGLENRIHIVFGDIDQTLDEVEGKFDLLFFDAGKSHYKSYFEKSRRLMKKDSVIISDNILFKGQIADESLVKRRNRTIVRNMQDYLYFLTHTKGIQTSIIPVGDGIGLSLIEEMID